MWNILLGFPEFQGPSHVNLTHLQSRNCDRHISPWKQGHKIRLVKRFKLGQDKTTGGNGSSSLVFSTWNELTSNFMFTEERYIVLLGLFCCQRSLTYGWHLGVQPLVKLKQLKRIDL